MNRKLVDFQKCSKCLIFVVFSLKNHCFSAKIKGKSKNQFFKLHFETAACTRQNNILDTQKTQIYETSLKDNSLKGYFFMKKQCFLRIPLVQLDDKKLENVWKR